MATDAELNSMPYKQRLQAVEEQYGERPRIPIAHGEALAVNHWRGETEVGEKFVYCPMGFLISWHPEDYNHKWCPWCKKMF